MNVYMGNFTTAQMASEMGIELSAEDAKALDAIRQDDAQNIKPGRYHCFDVPRMLVCGDLPTCYLVHDILAKYLIKGRWQIATTKDVAAKNN